MKKKNAKKATAGKKPSSKRPSKQNQISKEATEVKVEEVDALNELEIPVEDEQLPAGKGKARNKDKYKIQGDTQLYGKGRIVQAVVRKYVAEHPKVTYKQLKGVFEDSLIPRFGVFQDEETANSLSSSGRQRYFQGENDGIKLGDRKMVYTCSQITAKNILPFLGVCKELGIKITVAAKE